MSAAPKLETDVLTVSALTAQLRGLVEGRFPSVWVLPTDEERVMEAGRQSDRAPAALRFGGDRGQDRQSERAPELAGGVAHLRGRHRS